MFGPTTNKDCDSCDFCELKDISCDYEEEMYWCRKFNTGVEGASIANKACELPEGNHYKTVIKEYIRKTKK